MKKKTYGFIINKNDVPIDVKAFNEKKAFLKFIEKYWSRIKQEARNKTDPIRIESLGERISIN